jgi:hypothetical protein
MLLSMAGRVAASVAWDLYVKKPEMPPAREQFWRHFKPKPSSTYYKYQSLLPAATPDL